MNLLKKIVLTFTITLSTNALSQKEINYIKSTDVLNYKSSERKDLNLKDEKGNKYVTNEKQLFSAQYLNELKEPAVIPQNQIFRLVITNWYLAEKSFCIIKATQNKEGIRIFYRFYFKNNDLNIYELYAEGIAPQLMVNDLKSFLKSEEAKYLASWGFKQRMFGANEIGNTMLFSLEFRDANEVKVIDIYTSSLKEAIANTKDYDLIHRGAIFDFCKYIESVISSFGCLKSP